MSNVRVIQADKKRTRRYHTVVSNQLRVAAYCRVSTDSEEQQSSYHSQVLHYKNLVESKSEWQLVDIYADEGISGTGTKKRIEFQRMINDAMEGKIDLIITKSISRFARNTLDTLNYVRTLKEKGVAVMFEKENINTLTMNGEMLLVILSSLAQQESESISANVTMGLKMKMKRGELVGYNGCLGYDYRSEDKTITINEEEAEIVKYIFRRYVEGVGCFRISKELMNLGYKTKKGNKKWHESAVMGIIKNEKYKGDLLLGKTFTTDPITHRRLENFGEREKFYIENNHEPIISEEMFDKAQAILRKRSSRHNEDGKKRVYSRKHAFSSLCTCGYCGSTLIRRKWHSGTNHEKYTWQCSNSVRNGRKACEHSKAIDEKVLEEAFVNGYNRISKLYREAINEFIENVESALDIPTLKNDLKSLTNELLKNEEKTQKLVDMRLENQVKLETYNKKHEVLKAEHELFTKQIKEIQQSLESEKSISIRVRNFKEIFNDNEIIDEFDRDILGAIIEKVVVGAIDENGN